MRPPTDSECQRLHSSHYAVAPYVVVENSEPPTSLDDRVEIEIGPRAVCLICGRSWAVRLHSHFVMKQK